MNGGPDAWLPLPRRALGVACALAALTAPPAASAEGRGCRDGSYCLWTKKDYQGDKLVVTTNKLVDLPSFINNRASSLKNREDLPVVFFTGRNGAGQRTCRDPGHNEPELSPNLNNAISSADVRDVICV
jgi:Peptidase inhibitor family I36